MIHTFSEYIFLWVWDSWFRIFNFLFSRSGSASCPQPNTAFTSSLSWAASISAVLEEALHVGVQASDCVCLCEHAQKRKQCLLSCYIYTVYVYCMCTNTQGYTVGMCWCYVVYGPNQISSILFPISLSLCFCLPLSALIWSCPCHGDQQSREIACYLGGRFLLGSRKLLRIDTLSELGSSS